MGGGPKLEEIAYGVLILATDGSDFTTGKRIIIDGGLTAI